MRFTKEIIQKLKENATIDKLPKGCFVSGFAEGKNYFPLEMLSDEYVGEYFRLETDLIHANGGIEFYITVLDEDGNEA